MILVDDLLFELELPEDSIFNKAPCMTVLYTSTDDTLIVDFVSSDESIPSERSYYVLKDLEAANYSSTLAYLQRLNALDFHPPLDMDGLAAWLLTLAEDARAMALAFIANGRLLSREVLIQRGFLSHFHYTHSEGISCKFTDLPLNCPN